MLRFVMAATLAAGGLLPAQAALPPQYQRLAELKAVLDHPGVASALRGHMIDRVEFLSPDRYRVTAGPCALDVAIVSRPTPPGLVGPRQFEVVPGAPACR